MNSDQLGGILRAIMPAAIAYAVAKGWVSASSAADVGAALVTLAMAVWSIYTNKSGKTIA